MSNPYIKQKGMIDMYSYDNYPTQQRQMVQQSQSQQPRQPEIDEADDESDEEAYYRGRQMSPTRLPPTRLSRQIATGDEFANRGGYFMGQSQLPMQPESVEVYRFPAPGQLSYAPPVSRRFTGYYRADAPSAPVDIVELPATPAVSPTPDATAAAALVTVPTIAPALPPAEAPMVCTMSKLVNDSPAAFWLLMVLIIVLISVIILLSVLLSMCRNNSASHT